MQAFLGLIGALIGASASIVTTIAVQRWRHRSEAQGRRDDRLLNQASDFASAVRRLASLADRYFTAADQQGFPGRSPSDRLGAELVEFYRSVRAQLRLNDAEEVLGDDPDLWDDVVS